MHKRSVINSINKAFCELITVLVIAGNNLSLLHHSLEFSLKYFIRLSSRQVMSDS